MRTTKSLNIHKGRTRHCLVLWILAKPESESTLSLPQGCGRTVSSQLHSPLPFGELYDNVNSIPRPRPRPRPRPLHKSLPTLWRHNPWPYPLPLPHMVRGLQRMDSLEVGTRAEEPAMRAKPPCHRQEQFKAFFSKKSVV